MSATDNFRDQMRQVGLDYAGPLITDGELHRFKCAGDRDRNSWYVLHDGPPMAGAFGCWKRDLKETWHEGNGELSRAEWQHVRRQWKEAEAKQRVETSTRQRKACQVAAWILNRTKPAATHAYLAAKRVQPFGEMSEYRGALVLPLRDINGDLHSLQFISPDGSKKFLTGGRVAACFFTLADKSEGPLVICEGYATGASIHEATNYAVLCAMNCSNLLITAEAARKLWPEREIVIAADNDQFTDGNPGLTKATIAAKKIRAKLAIPQFKDLAAKPTDFNDFAAAESLGWVKHQIDAAVVPVESDAEAFERLAALSHTEYDRCRQQEADALGIRVATLDDGVKRLRRCRWTGGDDSKLQGCAIDLPEIEPWPESVDGAQVLSECADCLSSYVALPPGGADAIALWAAHCHALELFQITPRLNVTSPEKGCGKTTARDVLALLVPRPLSTENTTTPVLFRLIATRKPTVLADEYDAWLRDNDELRGLLNAGHRRGGQAHRCEGDNHEVRSFPVFAPAVLCGIGALPGTLQDRSIVIRLARAKPGEVQQRFDSRRTLREQELCRKLARFCVDNRVALETCDPELPPGAFNRIADNWRPLFAVAQVAGGDWPQRAAAAFALLTSKEDEDAQGIGVMLLADIREVFSQTALEEIFSRVLVEKLCAMTDRPWLEANRGKAITQTWLANRLRPFGVRSGDIRIDDESAKDDKAAKQHAKGYKKADFKEAFERYLPEPKPESQDQGESKRANVQPRINIGLDENSKRADDEVAHGLKSLETPIDIDLARLHGLNLVSSETEVIEL